MMFETDDTITLLARLIYGEARGESLLGMVAVAHVVRNRTYQPRWWGKTWREVMLKPWQFSCFNAKDPNLKEIERVSGIRWQTARWVAQGVIQGKLEDPTKGATHYFSTDVYPAWADGLDPTVIIGRHKFYK